MRTKQKSDRKPKLHTIKDKPIKKVNIKATAKTNQVKITLKEPSNIKATTTVAKERTVVAPWRSTPEFQNVFKLLFSVDSTPKDRREALSCIRVWSLRRGYLCPATVLATSVLVNAQLQDTEGNCNIQTTYASAFTRFYNFMSSIMQGHNMTTMYETARKLGMHSLIVDLRHLCAHGQELPPVEVLRNASYYCLDWLKSYYWEPQSIKMRNLDAAKLSRKDKLKFDTELTSLVEMYDHALECHLCGAEKLKAVAKIKPSATFNKLRLYCSQKNIKTTREVLDAVLYDISGLVKREGSLKELLDIYIAGLLKLKYFLVAGLLHKGEQVINATQGLFRMLALQGYIENFFVALVKLTENQTADDERRRGACFWALKMIETFTMLKDLKRIYQEKMDANPELKPIDFSTLNTRITSKAVCKLIAETGVDQGVTLIFGENTKRPRTWVFERDFYQQRLAAFNEHTSVILAGLLPLAATPYTEKQQKHLANLCEQLFKPIKPEVLEKVNISQTKLDEMLANLPATLNINFNNSKCTEFGIWKLETSTDWSKCALGVLPWAEKE